MVGRGDVWWGETPDEKGRPFLVVMLVRRLGALGPRVRDLCRVAGATLDC